jgi:hypothetical protein
LFTEANAFTPNNKNVSSKAREAFILSVIDSSRIEF